MQDTRNKLQVFLSLPVVFIINYLTQYRTILDGSIQIGQYRLVERKPKKSMFTASDVKAVGGISYRQLNDWDSKGALPTQRVGSSGWRKFDSRQLFVILICAEIRNKFGVSIEKLAWLQNFMLQDGANHFLAAVEMMKYGMAVLILTDLRQQFDMDSDFAIGDLLRLGYCRYDQPQSYVVLLVNPIINKMLAALKNPTQLKISDKVYDALDAAEAGTKVRDTAELAVLETMRQTNTSKFTAMQTNDQEILLEIEMKDEKEGTGQRVQRPRVEHEKDPDTPISRTIVKKVARENIGIIAVRVNG
jgi:DNA-binding transcriptional MerR regulator